MRLQTESILASSEKANKYMFLHPATLRRCFAWIPISQVKELPFNEIEIPDWLWVSIKRQL